MIPPLPPIISVTLVNILLTYNIDLDRIHTNSKLNRYLNDKIKSHPCHQFFIATK